LAFQVLKLNSKIVCISRDVTFDKSSFPSLSNESIDQATVQFNPFNVAPEIDEDENDSQFRPFPEQKVPAIDDSGPRDEIIGDIDPQNILMHGQRGAELYAAESQSLTYNQVLSSSDKIKWVNAIDKEVDNMKDYKVWDVINKNSEDKPLSCTWVFKIKTEASNQTEKHKARLCVQGFNEVFGCDYNFTYAPTGKLTSLCLLINFALQNNLKFHQINVKCAFLNAPIQERITLNPPPGLKIPNNKLLLLKKALYGLKQAPQAWHFTLSSWLLSVGFNCSYAEPCVLWSSNTWLYVHVDDIATFSSEPDVFKNMIKRHFKIKDLGEAKHLLGMEVIQSSDEI
jgi:hypothetical protein